MSVTTGSTHVSLSIAVPASEEAAGDALFAKHAAWVKKTHKPMGLLQYTVTKNKELGNQLDPTSAATGRVVFNLSEVYEKPQGLADHWSAAPSSGILEDFVAFFTGEGKTVVVCHGAPIIHSIGPQDLE